MKKVLLGTTALLGAALFAQQAAAEITVTVGGSVGFQAGFFDDDAADSSDRDFQVESEILVRADGKADNGLLYGAKVEILTSQNDTSNADEVVMYLAGNWGRVELGGEDGATDTMNVFAPTVGIGQLDGAFSDFVADASVTFDATNTGDATKITYYTPRFSGFQFGASYTPELGSEGENVIQVDTASGSNTQSDIIELGANYQGTFSDVKLTLSGGYAFGDAKDGSGREDISAWVVGAQVGYGAFTFGGGYVDNGDSNATSTTVDLRGWNVGASYKNGPWAVAVSYANEDDDTVDTDLYSVGATYAIAPGLTTSADLGFFDVEETGNDRSGYVLVLETKVAF